MNEEPVPYLVIEPTPSQKNYIRDLFRHKEIFLFLAWRDIIVRYKQTFFGVAWALFRPIISMVIFVAIFSKIANLPSMGINYSFFVFAGILPWIFFSNIVSETTSSLLNNHNLITKIYFPRMIIPTSQIIVNLLDFSITMVMMIILSAISGELSWRTIGTLPIWIALMISLSIGASLWMSALTLKYRDVRLLVPFFIQFGMFASPVGYASFIIPEKWLWLYSLNPLVGIIDGFRFAFFNISHPGILHEVISSFFVTTLLLVSGFYYFRKLETQFADII